jgi:type IV pilus secretin PilQ/predicted competence protein
MAGMKTRFTRFKNFVSKRVQIGSLGILILLLALAVSATAIAQDNLKSSNPAQPPQAPKSAVGNPDGSGMPQVGAITDVKLAPEDGKLTVTLMTDRLLAPKEFRLDNPPRLVLDFKNAENRVKLTQVPVNASSIKQIRVQQFQSSDPKTVRVVFDLDEGFGNYEMALDRSSVRVVFRQGQAAPKAKPAISPVERAADQPSKAPVVKDLPKAAPKTEQQKARLDVHPAAAQVERAFVPQAKSLLVSDLPRITPKNEEQKPRPELVVQAIQLPLATAAPVSVPVAAYNPPAPSPVAQTNSRFSGQPLTLDLINTSLVDFFRLMAEEGGINIVLDPEVKGNISIKVVKLPWDQIFDAALINNDLDKQVEGNLVRIARKATIQNEAKQRETLKKATLLAADVETRIKRLNYAKASSFIKALEEQKTVRGTVVVDERTNSLILTDIPSSLDKLYQLIETLDTPQPQVEIEARIVSASRDFAREIGIQFGFVQGNLQRITVGGSNTYGTIGGSRPSATPGATPVAANESTGRGTTSAGASGAVSTGSGGNYNVNLPATKAFGGMGISIGNIFDTFLLDAAITAGESKGFAKLISQPKVTAQNNNPAVITQGLRFPVPVVANNTVSVQFFNAALTLTATPQITYEGNIILDLKIENNSADFAKNVDGVPSIRTSESTTRVLISDGGTTVIAGILIEDESTQEDKVPGLGSLPLIGNIFRRSSVSRSTQEVLFFVTPRIIK